MAGVARGVLSRGNPALWEANRSWLSPAHWDADAGRVRVAVQTWLLRSAGRTILIDTGLGVGTASLPARRFRPHWPPPVSHPPTSRRRLERPARGAEEIDEEAWQQRSDEWLVALNDFHSNARQGLWVAGETARRDMAMLMKPRAGVDRQRADRP